MSNPKVTVLMLTYDRPQKIGRAIASLCAQSFQNWELIIVEDGRNSETQELVSEWLAREPRIRYFVRETVGSIAEASNFGLERALGEYIAILDDDDYWSDAEKLARQVEFLDRNPEHVACGTGYQVIDQDGRQRGSFLKPEHDGAIRTRALIANPILNSTSMFRRLIGGSPVGYDILIRQFADWDFWLTMGTRGKLYNFPTTTTQYTLWAGGSSFTAQRKNALAAIRIVRKHRREYRGFGVALALAYLYFGYACLPPFVRRYSYVTLSSLKKSLAAGTDACRRANASAGPR